MKGIPASKLQARKELKLTPAMIKENLVETVYLKGANKLSFKYTKTNAAPISIIDTIKKFYNGFFHSGTYPKTPKTPFHPNNIAKKFGVKIYTNTDEKRPKHVTPGIPYLVIYNPSTTDADINTQMHIRLEPKGLHKDHYYFQTLSKLVETVDTLETLMGKYTFDEPAFKEFLVQYAENFHTTKVDYKQPIEDRYKIVPTGAGMEDYIKFIDDNAQVNKKRIFADKAVATQAKPLLDSLVQQLFGVQKTIVFGTKQEMEAIQSQLKGKTEIKHKNLKNKANIKDDNKIWYIAITDDNGKVVKYYDYILSTKRGKVKRTLNALSHANESMDDFVIRNNKMKSDGTIIYAAKDFFINDRTRNEYYGRLRNMYLELIKEQGLDKLAKRSKKLQEIFKVIEPGQSYVTKQGEEFIADEEILEGSIGKIEIYFKALYDQYGIKELSPENIEAGKEYIKSQMKTNPLQMSTVRSALKTDAGGRSSSIRTPLWLLGGKGNLGVNKAGENLNKENLDKLEENIESYLDEVIPTSLTITTERQSFGSPASPASPEQNTPTPPPTDPVSDEDWNKFVNTGKVSDEILEALADKVQNQEPLSIREQGIYNGSVSEINKILNDRFKAAQTPEQTYGKNSYIGQYEGEPTDLEARLRDIIKNSSESKHKQLAKLLLSSDLSGIGWYKLPKEYSYPNGIKAATTQPMGLYTTYMNRMAGGLGLPTNYFDNYSGPQVLITDNKDNVSDTVFLHELIHGVTLAGLQRAEKNLNPTKKDLELHGRLTTLHARVKEEGLDIYEVSPSDPSPIELVASLSNLRFMQSTAKAKGAKNKIKELIRGAIEGILTFLGLSPNTTL